MGQDTSIFFLVHCGLLQLVYSSLTHASFFMRLPCATERLSLTKKMLEIERKREKRLREEQKLRKEKLHRQTQVEEQIKQVPNIQPSTSSNGEGSRLLGGTLKAGGYIVGAVAKIPLAVIKVPLKVMWWGISSSGKTHVNSYYRKDGTFVKGHDRRK